MDELSEGLIISIHLQDIEEVLAARKGKGREGDLAASNDELAFNTYRRYLQDSEQCIIDRRMAESLEEAMRMDCDVLAEIASVEGVAKSDRDLALRLGGGSVEGASPPDLESGEWASALDHKSGVSEIAMNEWQARLMLEDQMGVRGQWFEFCYRGPWHRPSDRYVAKMIEPQGRCEICFGTFSASHTLDAPCGHTYCQSCMKKVFLNACLDEMLFPPRCCRREIPFHMAEKVLSRREVSEFESKSREYISKDRTYCCRPTCSKFISSDYIRGDIGTCPKCFVGTCVMCKKEQHPGDCPEDKSLNLTLELAARSGWQRCKNCHALVEISSGCHHMTCRCKAEWCYKCGVPWKKCECSDWDDGRLDRRAEELAMRGAPPNANQATIVDLVGVYRGNLQGNHECQHVSGWNFRNGKAQCEMCFGSFRCYIFSCKGCELLACNGCRKNRI
ncbi:hypothetical protein HOY80DRAFT_881387 [Tuber brumale]|nr:hypothetical protein HOY80DRAFT_881387 [Tuber brumale]